MKEQQVQNAKELLLAYLNPLPPAYRDSAYLMAYYVAVPIVFTPEMLYQLWLNFSHFGKNGQTEQIHIVSIADLIQSNLCEKIGYELYEMDSDVVAYFRNLSPTDIQTRRDIRISADSRRQVTEFVLAYADKFLNNPKYRNLYDVYNSTLLWEVNPQKAIAQLKQLLDKAQDKTNKKQVRMWVESLLKENIAFQNETAEYHKLPILSATRQPNNSYDITEALKKDEELWEKVQKIIKQDGITYGKPVEILDFIKNIQKNKIKKIYLSDYYIDDLNIDIIFNALCELEYLEELYIHPYYPRENSEYSYISFIPASISSLINLNKIKIGGSNYMGNSYRDYFVGEWGIKDITPIKNLKNLNYIDLSYNKINDISIVANFKHLKTFIIDRNMVLDYSPLVYLEELTFLSINNNFIKDATSLQYLQKIEMLFLEYNNIENTDFLNNLINLKELYIAYNNITNFSFGLLKNLTNLQVLRLQGNPIENLPKEIFDFEGNCLPKVKVYFAQNIEYAKILIQETKEKGYKELDLGCLGLTSLEDLPELFELKELEVLQLGEFYYDWEKNDFVKTKNTGKPNIIKQMPTKLNDLLYLKKLYFRNIGLEDCFMLNRFKNKRLKVLDLAGNPLKSLMPLGNMHIDSDKKLALEELYLGSVNISHLPEKYLRDNLETTIKYLDLSEVKGVKPKDLEKIVSRFTNLEKLNLMKNDIRNIDFLKNLQNLVSLNLSQNSITHLTKEFLDNFPNLQELLLEGNIIVELLPDFDFGGNCLERVKEVFSQANQVTQNDGIQDVNGKKNINLSEEILSQGSEAVASYVEEKEAHEAEYLHECKLVLIGNGQVGKTSIRTKLLDRSAKLPTSSTHGIDVEEWHTTIEHEGKPIKFKFNVWDFGGQGKYRAVQQFFCSRNAVYLYVTSYDDEEINGQDDYTGFTFWYPFIQAFGYNTEKSQYSPVIHIRNKQDKGIKPLEEKEFVDLYPQIYPDFLQISCETLYNFDKLEEAIKKVLPIACPDVFTFEYPRNWLAVKGELEMLYKKMQKTITYQQYLAICAKHQMDKKNADIWLKVLDSIGTVIHFGKIDKLKDLIVLNPEWVKEAAYRVLSRADIERNYGIFKDYADIWKGRNFEKEWHSGLLELMLAFEICYVGRDNYGRTSYYVPSLFPLRTATEANIFDELTQDLEGEMYHFELRYKPFMPAGVLHKLVVRQNQYVYQDLRWRNCMILYNKYTFVEVIEHWKERKITLRVKGENVKEGYRMVVNTLQHINDEIREGKLLSMLEFEAYALYGDEYEPFEKLGKKFKVEAFSFLFDEETPKIEPEIMKKEYETLEKIGILYTHSSPENMTRARPDYGVIETALKHCIQVGEVVLHPPNLTTSYSILQKELKEKHPEILHYSGHGTQEGISLYNEVSKKEQPIASNLLQDIFEGRSKYLKLVFLNSCFSSAQAQIISQQGIYVLGINEPKISNDKASELARHFYDGIAGMEFPLSIERAIKIGCQNFALTYPNKVSLISLWKDGVPIDYRTL